MPKKLPQGLPETDLCSHLQEAAESLRRLRVELWVNGSDAALTAACGPCQRVVTLDTYPPDPEE